MSKFDKRTYGEKMKRTSSILIQLLICTLLLGTLTFAHGGMEHILGTVTAITDHSLSVKTREERARQWSSTAKPSSSRAIQQPQSKTFSWETGS